MSLFILLSCNKDVGVKGVEDVNFENAYYHPSFLFSKEKNDIVSKTLQFEFNEFAEQSAVTIGFFDEEGRLMSEANDGFKLFVNDSEVSGGKLELSAQQGVRGEIKISVLYPPKDKTKRYKGLIKVISGDIDRINYVDNLTEDPIFTWSGTHVVRMNPLKKWLLISLGVIVAALLIWLIILRPIAFTRFRRSSVTINSPFYSRIKIKGAVSLTLTDKRQKQSFWSKLFKGKDLVYVNPFFTQPITIMPKSKTDVRIRTGANYILTPFATFLTLNQTYELKNNQTGEKITIS